MGAWNELAKSLTAAKAPSMAARTGLVPMTKTTTGYTPVPLTAPKAQPGWGYYDPNSTYGGRRPEAGGFSKDPQNWFRTEVSEDYGENNPKGAYTAWQTMMGAGGDDPYSRWLQSQYTDLRDAYSASKLNNPAMRWRKFLEDIRSSQMQNKFAALSAEQRGVDIPTQVKTILPG